MPSAGLSINLGLWPNVASPPPYRLIVAGEDILSPGINPATNQPLGGVPFDSMEWQYTSSQQPAQMTFDHWDPTKAYNIPGQAEVRLWDRVLDEDAFWGFLIAREAAPAFGTGRIVRMRAVDASMLLDRTIVTRRMFGAGRSDRSIIQSLFAQFYIGPPLVVSGDYIAQTNTSMPEMTFELTTLRAAIDQVGKAADADGLGERFCYIDAQRRVQYYRSPFADPAPYVVTDDNPPGGGEKSVSDLELVYDDSDIVTAVYIKGSTKIGSGWSSSSFGVSLYGWRAEALEVPDSDTEAKREAYGQAYLRGKDRPIRRGSFTIVGTAGWKADQLVQITSTNLGLAAESFDIKHVTVRAMSGTPTFEHTIEFGARKPGQVRPQGRLVTNKVGTIGRTIVAR